jgi:hypothetical protein
LSIRSGSVFLFVGMAALVALVADRDQFPQELVADVNVGQVVDMLSLLSDDGFFVLLCAHVGIE